jgi:hypothetical protein
MDFTEQDLATVQVLQESRGCTPEQAKAAYRKYVNKLPNPDIENRAELILDSINRGVPENGQDKEPAAEKPTRNEKRLAKKKAKADKKAKAPKAAKKGSKKTDSTPRVECELAKLERDVELTPTEQSGVYTANLFGRKTAVVWAERNRSNGAAARFETVNVSEKRLDNAKKYAKENDLPVAVCVTVRVIGKLDQGYAVPLALFNKLKTGSNAFALSGAARKAYAEEGYADCKFVVKAQEKAA